MNLHDITNPPVTLIQYTALMSRLCTCLFTRGERPILAWSGHIYTGTVCVLVWA